MATRFLASSNVMILGGAGLVGQSIARRLALLPIRPAQNILASRTRDEALQAIEPLRYEQQEQQTYIPRLSKQPKLSNASTRGMRCYNCGRTRNVTKNSVPLRARRGLGGVHGKGMNMLSKDPTAKSRHFHFMPADEQNGRKSGMPMVCQLKVLLRKNLVIFERETLQLAMFGQCHALIYLLA